MDKIDLRTCRSLLFLPASNPRAIEKARELPADLIVLDLEDAVRGEEKAEARRMVGAYGTRIDRVLGPAQRGDQIGPWFGKLSAAEVRYLVSEEWARTAEDVLWRRTKFGLTMSAKEMEALAAFMATLPTKPGVGRPRGEGDRTPA